MSVSAPNVHALLHRATLPEPAGRSQPDRPHCQWHNARPVSGCDRPGQWHNQPATPVTELRRDASGAGPVLDFLRVCTAPHHVVGRLLLLFIAIPIIELFLLVEIGQRVGTLTTVGIIIATGAVGASLARQQGMSTLARLRADLAAGRSPADPIVDGVLILVAAAVLITPGLLTDLAGFLCLIPAFRRLVKRYLRRTFERAVRKGTVGVTAAFEGAGDSSRRPPMKNVTPRRPGDSGGN